MRRAAIRISFAVLSIAVACGSDAQARRIRDERRATCEGIVASGLSSAQVVDAFGFGPLALDCLQPGRRFASAGPDDRCPYETARVCERTWQFEGGSRCYQCRVRSVISGDPQEPAVSTAPVCATIFYDDQPCF